MLEGHKIVPVVVIKTLEDTVPTLRGLSEGGLILLKLHLEQLVLKMQLH